MKVRFLKVDAITIGGIARGFAIGDERDYLPDAIVQQKLNAGVVELVEDKANELKPTSHQPKVSYKNKKQHKTKREDKRLDHDDSDNKDDVTLSEHASL